VDLFSVANGSKFGWRTNNLQLIGMQNGSANIGHNLRHAALKIPENSCWFCRNQYHISNLLTGEPNRTVRVTGGNGKTSRSLIKNTSQSAQRRIMCEKSAAGVLSQVNFACK